jgi:hypothetical protein
MTHVMEMPDVLAEIDAFRETLAEHFITFDPGDLDEKRLLIEAGAATQRGEKSFTLMLHGREMEFPVSEITNIADDIDGQIYARDFKMIDQSDMIISYIPETTDGKPGISSGVERELQHAFEATKEVYIVWRPTIEPSPFVTETATDIFSSVEEMMFAFQKRGYVKDYQLRFSGPKPPRERGRLG